MVAIVKMSPVANFNFQSFHGLATLANGIGNTFQLFNFSPGAAGHFDTPDGVAQGSAVFERQGEARGAVGVAAGRIFSEDLVHFDLEEPAARAGVLHPSPGAPARTNADAPQARG